MPATEVDDLTQIAARLEAAVREAGALALSMFQTPLKNWTKGPSASPVSEADIAVDNLLRQRLIATGETVAWLSEESIDDAARFYQRQAGIPAAKFLTTAKSFDVDRKVRADDDLTQAYKIDRTPTIVVNGKYRLHMESAGGGDQLIDLVKWLVAKEST